MTAYVVAHAFGLDTKAHSLHYTAQWTQNLEHVTELETALEEVKHVSHTLISRLETLLEHEQLNMQVNLKDASKSKNSALAQAFFSIHTIEPITQIGTHRVYDLELHSKTMGPQKYRILTTKKPNEIAHTWVGEKSGTDWLKEYAPTARKLEAQDLKKRIKRIFYEEGEGTYGARRIHALLEKELAALQEERICSIKRVQMIMRQLGLVSCH